MLGLVKNTDFVKIIPLKGFEHQMHGRACF